MKTKKVNKRLRVRVYRGIKKAKSAKSAYFALFPCMHARSQVHQVKKNHTCIEIAEHIKVIVDTGKNPRNIYPLSKTAPANDPVATMGCIIFLLVPC